MKHLSNNTLNILEKDFQINHFQTQQLIQMCELYLKWNQKHNLISKSDEEIIWERHILDSLTMKQFLKTNNPSLKILDMGSGMGFPLIPNSITSPAHEFHSIEPREKRVRILRQLKRELKINNLHLNTGKAEDYVSRETQEKFDVVSCRALGNLQEDWKRAEVFLKPGGKFITFKTHSEKHVFTEDPWVYKEYSFLEDTEPYYIVVRVK